MDYAILKKISLPVDDVLHYAHVACVGSYQATIAPADAPFIDWSVEWEVRGDLIDFVVTGFGGGWVAIGFSQDPFMVTTKYLEQAHA